MKKAPTPKTATERPTCKKHDFQFISYGGRPLSLGFMCRHCREQVSRKATPGERRYFKPQMDRTFKMPIHRVWHDLLGKFLEKDATNPNPGFRIKGYDLMEELDAWAEKYPHDVRIIGVDDDHHMSSSLVMVEHQSESQYMGTSVLFVPQNGEPPSKFFLYPGALDTLIKALQDIRKVSRVVKKKEWAAMKVRSKANRKNLRHPPVI